MNDLISRQAAIDAIHEEFDECLVWDESGRHTADEVEQILDNLPSAQSEIVECEQCKYSGGATPIADGRYWCTLHCAFMSYCSDAEILERGVSND